MRLDTAVREELLSEMTTLKDRLQVDPLAAFLRRAPLRGPILAFEGEIRNTPDRYFRVLIGMRALFKSDNNGGSFVGSLSTQEHLVAHIEKRFKDSLGAESWREVEDDGEKMEVLLWALAASTSENAETMLVLFRG